MAAGIERKGKDKEHLTPWPGPGSWHAFATWAAHPRRRAMEGSSAEAVLPWLLPKHSWLGSWWRNWTLGLGRRTPTHPGEALQLGSLAAPVVLTGNYIPTASSCAACAARAAHWVLVWLSPHYSAVWREAGVVPIERVPSLGSTRSTCWGRVFWDGEIRWLIKWKQDDKLLKHHVLTLQVRRVKERCRDTDMSKKNIKISAFSILHNGKSWQVPNPESLFICFVWELRARQSGFS